MPRFGKVAHSAVIATTDQNTAYLVEFLADGNVYTTQVNLGNPLYILTDHTIHEFAINGNVSRWAVQQYGTAVNTTLGQIQQKMRLDRYSLLDGNTCHTSQETMRQQIVGGIVKTTLQSQFPKTMTAVGIFGELARMFGK